MSGDIGAASCGGRILVAGIGNLLLGDEGLGVHAVRELRNMRLPEDVELLDAGTAFIDALPHIGEARRLIIIDAVMGGNKPGTVYRCNAVQDPHANHGTSIHGLSLIETMQMGRSLPPEKVSVIGIEPEYIGWSMELSNTVRESMPVLIEAVCGEITAYVETREMHDKMPGVC